VLSFNKLQEESRQWVAKNFGQRPKHQPLLGLFEEYGELLISVTKEELADAIADITIFAVDVCNANDMNLDQILYRHPREDLSWLDDSSLLKGIGTTIGKIAHHFLKREQNIRGTYRDHTDQIETRISQLIGFLNEYCVINGLNFEETVLSVWHNVVEKRNWRKTA
jgi:NTP pyrophosphatase (non-canonical NTP hydrolase)